MWHEGVGEGGGDIKGRNDAGSKDEAVEVV